MVARVDVAYPEVKLAIEVEGWEFHMGKVVWKKDLRRRNRLISLGWRVLHLTSDDLTRRPSETVEQIRATGDSSGAAGLWTSEHRFGASRSKD